MIRNLIRCKRVTKEDYEKVMAIFPPSEIYNGGFSLMTTVDDGRSIVTRAGRISKEYAGQGIGGIMLKWMNKGSPLYRPEVLWHKTAGNATDSPLPQLIKTGVYTKTLEQDIRCYDTHKTTLHNKDTVMRKNNPSFKAERIDDKLLGEILESNDHKQFLFPENEIVADYVPYRAMNSNASLIVSKRTSVVVSDLNCPQRTLLSISNFWQAPLGMVCNFNVYGCVSGNIKEHLILHFAKCICRPLRDYILLRCISSKGTSLTFLDNAVEEYGFNRTEFYGKGLVSVRRRIASKL
ncbi:uncharacterized protein LOC134689649 isoform X2 [Mytilus trossulus]|uniref:uncharacterized protein LOC134689649 isoform X2 n=1 Tax=Mytilus trossulus TaxID=6551 RepID=UPI003006586C